MATLFIDFEQGNDNYGGTSFNLLASGTDGRITSTTFSAATASFPNDGSLINQYLSIFNGTIYAIYRITAWISSTSLTIAAISGGTALANQAVDRQYYIGGRWQTLTNGATAVRIIPDDEIRVMASPDPTSLGVNGTWTSSPLQPTRSISSSTNATPIVVTCNAHGYADGDTIVITGHNTNTNANGTWEISNVTTNTFTLVNSIGNGVGGATGTARLRNNSVVKLASPVTANIASTGNRGNGRTAWTQSTNVVASLNTSDYKEGDVSDSIAINATFTTGLAAFKSTGTLDLSGYQQVSFFIKQTAGTVTVAGDVSLRLCSDTSGATTVHTIPIPALGALNVWQPITVDLATNLNSNIQSIALYIDTDRGAVTFLLSNIIACKAKSSADSLSLISLIGKNTGTEPWIAIQSINGTRVFLDGLVSHLPTTTSLMGYYGVSETVTTHKRETIPIYSSQTVNEIATLILSGGWDRTNMSTQNSYTYLDNRRGNISLLVTKDRSTVNRFGLFRSNSAIDMARSVTVSNCKDINHNTTAFSTGASDITISGINNISFNNNGIQFGQLNRCNVIDITNINSNSNNPFFHAFATYPKWNVFIKNITNINNNNGYMDLQYFTGSVIDNIQNINYNGSRSISLHSSSNCIISNISGIIGSANPIYLSSCENCIIQNISAINGATVSAITTTSCGNNKFININTSGSTTSSISVDLGNHYFQNCNLSESTLVTVNAIGLYGSVRDPKVYLHQHNNITNNHIIYFYGGLIASETSIRNTSSGISWKFSPTITDRNMYYPLSLSLAKILVFANKLVTIKGYLRRDNTGLTVQLRVPAYQIAGVNSDVVAAMTASANTWQEVTLTFTPTETGVVELLGEAYGGTTFNGYIDDLTITQAP